MRHKDWQVNFWAHLKAAREKPFEWGEFDCVMFATSCIDVVMGTDYFQQAKVRYPYDTEEKALEWMNKVGGITGLVSSFLGDPGPWGQLSVGDICIVKPMPLVGTTIEMLCVHDGTNLVGVARKGIARVPFQYAIHGWRLR